MSLRDKAKTAAWIHNELYYKDMSPESLWVRVEDCLADKKQLVEECGFWGRYAGKLKNENEKLTEEENAKLTKQNEALIEETQRAINASIEKTREQIIEHKKIVELEGKLEAAKNILDTIKYDPNFGVGVKLERLKWVLCGALQKEAKTHE